MKKRFSSFTALVLIAAMMFVFGGCGAEKKKIDISDGGNSSGKDKPTEQATSPTPTDEPVSESFRFPLNADHGTKWAEVEGIKAGSDGKIVVILVGEGAGFDGVLSMRNGSFVIPFEIKVILAGKEYTADKNTTQSERFVAHFDLTGMPDAVCISSADEPDKVFSAPVSDGKVTQAPSLEYKPEITEEALPAGWHQEEEKFDWGDVAGVEKKTYDEKGRLRDYWEQKGSEQYDFRAEFHMIYTYTEGSKEVSYEENFISYKYDGTRTDVGRAIARYTMQSEDNRVELGMGWSGNIGKAADGAAISKPVSCDGTEYDPNGSKVKDIKKLAIETLPVE